METRKCGTSGHADEIRGVYIATVLNINYPSRPGLSADTLRSELDAILDTCTKIGFNAVFFQVSPCSDALYRSDILPVSLYLTGKEGDALPDGFDPLDYLCTAAHARGIAVHAWVNPMRVTVRPNGREVISPDNPAYIHPEWTVEYAGGIYYNLSMPEPQTLQASVCAEIARKYPVDGVMFDDYFYPYPEPDIEFDDARAYADYALPGESLGDFRRRSVNELVRGCYEAVKAEREDCIFGIAPLGVWKNDDGTNGGSKTHGMDSYEWIYCDTLAFAQGGYVDYIAPQLYSQFSDANTPYGVLCDWWDEALSGTKAKLMISHASYKAQEWDSTEFTEQVEFARKEQTYIGHIMFGYAAIKANEGELHTQLLRAYGHNGK